MTNSITMFFKKYTTMVATIQHDMSKEINTDKIKVCHDV